MLLGARTSAGAVISRCYSGTGLSSTHKRIGSNHWAILEVVKYHWQAKFCGTGRIVSIKHAILSATEFTLQLHALTTVLVYIHFYYSLLLYSIPYTWYTAHGDYLGLCTKRRNSDNRNCRFVLCLDWPNHGICDREWYCWWTFVTSSHNHEACLAADHRIDVNKTSIRHFRIESMFNQRRLMVFAIWVCSPPS